VVNNVISEFEGLFSNPVTINVQFGWRDINGQPLPGRADSAEPPNPLNRYSVGTKNKDLKYNADGSLTLYAGAKSPDKDSFVAGSHAFCIGRWAPAARMKSRRCSRPGGWGCE
jgi:Protein of unknown function (DUF1214)